MTQGAGPGAGSSTQAYGAAVIRSGRLNLLFVVLSLSLAVLLGGSGATTVQGAQGSATGPVRVEGAVSDRDGDAVVGASVTLVVGTATENRKTDSDGHFVFDAAPAAKGAIRVTAQGFAPIDQSWSAGPDGVAKLDLILDVSSPLEELTVTASRTEERIGDTASSIEVLSVKDISTTAALTLDDVLKQVPGFTLFRRSSSRTSNPTTQGVSLRGVGASGASRALVLSDGVPLNDPFGGWVYWDRVPREEIGRIEVLQGGASSLYGTDALGGVINLIRKAPEQSSFSLETSYGNENTPDGTMSASGRVGKWIGDIAAEAAHTGGYVIVDASQRGKVDTPAGGTHTALDLTLERLISEKGRVFARGSVFGESRKNGTPLTPNRTHIRELDMGADWDSRLAGTFALRLFGDTQVLDQDFSAVSATRNTESLTRSQRSPAQQIGVSAQWSRAIGLRQTAVAGADAREIHGSSDELAFANGAISSAVGAGGRERIAGIFGEDIIRVATRWLITLGLRYDHWRNYDALTATTPLAHPGPMTAKDFADRIETALSPRVSILYQVTKNLSLSASGYRAFRAPTLNELYRNFRVGNTLTNSNPDLRAERLTGWEGGANFSGLDRRVIVRGTFFWDDIYRPIANVTLAFIVPPPPAPPEILQQRQNLGVTRSRGVEIDASARLTGTISLSGGYEYVDATVLKFDQNPTLVNSLVPHVPRNQFTVQALYSNSSRFTASLQGRFVGNQFEDDFNTLSLGRLFTLDAFVSRRLSRNVEIFGAAENLTGQRYTVALTPVRTIGPPVLARVGFRLTLGPK